MSSNPDFPRVVEDASPLVISEEEAQEKESKPRIDPRRYRFARFPNWMMKSTFSPAAKLVFAYLVQCWNPKLRFAWPGIVRSARYQSSCRGRSRSSCRDQW